MHRNCPSPRSRIRVGNRWSKRQRVPVSHRRAQSTEVASRLGLPLHLNGELTVCRRARATKSRAPHAPMGVAHIALSVTNGLGISGAVATDRNSNADDANGRSTRAMLATRASPHGCHPRPERHRLSHPLEPGPPAGIQCTSITRPRPGASLTRDASAFLPQGVCRKSSGVQPPRKPLASKLPVHRPR